MYVVCLNLGNFTNLLCNHYCDTDTNYNTLVCKKILLQNEQKQGHF